MKKMFVVGFPRSMQEIALAELFSAHGIVNGVRIVTDQHTGESKGYGFVSLVAVGGAMGRIAALAATRIDAGVISVRIAEDKQSLVGQKAPAIDTPRKKRPRISGR
jgi:hypothetical protein